VWCAYRPAAQAVQFRETVSTPWYGRHRRPANVRDHTCVSRLRARRRSRSSRRAEKTSSGRNPTTFRDRDRLSSDRLETRGAEKTSSGRNPTTFRDRERLSSDRTEQRRDRVERVRVDVAEAVIVEIQYLQNSRRPSKKSEIKIVYSIRQQRMLDSHNYNKIRIQIRQ